MTTRKNEQDFSDEMESHISISMASLDAAISWMRSNLDPEDIFSTQQLEQWAEGEGYAKP